MNISNRNKISESMNKLLSEVKGKGEENMIETLAMRSMSKPFILPRILGTMG
jgi:ribonuclease R